VGSLGILAFLTAYVWAAATLGSRLPDQWAIRLVYYAVVGTAWGGWSERQDSNLRPLDPQSSALPGCATLRPAKGAPL
jgi:hypothetical protein